MARPIAIYQLEGGPNQFFSPFCWAAKFAVAHKGFPIENIRWRFREGDKIAFSKQGLVSFRLIYLLKDLCEHDTTRQKMTVLVAGAGHCGRQQGRQVGERLVDYCQVPAGDLSGPPIPLRRAPGRVAYTLTFSAFFLFPSSLCQ